VELRVDFSGEASELATHIRKEEVNLVVRKFKSQASE
jgi:hypothetical protein